VHALITYGGLDEEGQWQWPKHNKKIARYREMCKEYREIFLKMLNKGIAKNEIIPVPNMDELIQTIKNKRWNVRSEYPTTSTEVLERYLSRYMTDSF